MKIFKYLKFGAYMINMTLFKTIKLKNIKRNSGEKEAKDYCARVGEEWAKYTLYNTLGLNIFQLYFLLF